MKLGNISHVFLPSGLPYTNTSHYNSTAVYWYLLFAFCHQFQCCSSLVANIYWVNLKSYFFPPCFPLLRKKKTNNQQTLNLNGATFLTNQYPTLHLHLLGALRHFSCCEQPQTHRHLPEQLNSRCLPTSLLDIQPKLLSLHRWRLNHPGPRISPHTGSNMTCTHLTGCGELVVVHVPVKCDVILSVFLLFFNFLIFFFFDSGMIQGATSRQKVSDAT